MNGLAIIDRVLLACFFGLGITLIGWGLITLFIVTVAGLVVFVISLAGWIGGVCHDQQER
ncbi:MAG: hypothetical protein M1608_08745 [Candidatus Omnitrophica bacterium]|nr:hypothetical protein [Candidatus Omnitrophota bacterium]